MDAPELDRIDAILETFAVSEVLPRTEMQWCLNHWESVRRPFVEFLEGAAFDEEKPRWIDAVFVVAHLCGEMRERDAHAAICALLQDADQSEELFGDALTETIPGILIGTFDGDPSRLTLLVDLTEEADPFACRGALEVLGYLVAAGKTDFDIRGYLKELHTDGWPLIDGPLAAAWANTVARLGIEELVGEVGELFDAGAIESFSMEPSDFAAIFHLARDSVDPLESFIAEGVDPIESAIDAIAWAYLPRTLETKEAPLANPAPDFFEDEEELALPASNPLRDVGRNDACPCGSGKKYKNCCLRR